MTHRKVRDALVLAAVIAMFGFSLTMIRELVGAESPWFGLMLMFVVLGVAAFARPLARSWLPPFIRRPYAWEARGRAYRAMRVPAFGSLLRRTALRNLNTSVYLDAGRDRAAVIGELEWAEGSHYVAALVLAPYMVIAHIHGLVAAAAVLWFFQVAGNLYPILHLRWARIRLERFATIAGRRGMA